MPLGQALHAITRTVLAGLETPSVELETFCQKHERFADAGRLARISSPHAIKSWAAERLPGLGISYGFSNRLPHDMIEAHFDEQASLRIVQFADNLTMIARFCRRVDQLVIDVGVHSQGLEFRFRCLGQGLGAPFDDVERRGLEDLVKQHARDNCLKNRIIATEKQIEAQSIVLRKRIRLGYSGLN